MDTDGKPVGKSPYPAQDVSDMIGIPLTKNKRAYVDNDMGHLKKWRWQISSKGYAVRNHWIPEEKRSLTVFMHHCVVGKPINGMDIDHLNNDKLFNLRKNLRFATHRENSLNRKDKKNGKNSSEYPGIYFHKSTYKWNARIQVGNKRFDLGHYDDELDAANAYQRAWDALSIKEIKEWKLKKLL